MVWRGILENYQPQIFTILFPKKIMIVMVMYCTANMITATMTMMLYKNDNEDDDSYVPSSS